MTVDNSPEIPEAPHYLNPLAKMSMCTVCLATEHMGLLRPCKRCVTSEVCFMCLCRLIQHTKPSCPVCRTTYDIVDERFGMNFPTAITPPRREREQQRQYLGIGSTPDRQILDLAPQNLYTPPQSNQEQEEEEEIYFPSDSDDSTISPPDIEPLPEIEFDENTERLVFNNTGSLFD